MSRKPRHEFKLPVLDIARAIGKYKVGKLTLTGLVITLLMLFVGAASCTQPDTEGCIQWSAFWEASNR